VGEVGTQRVASCNGIYKDLNSKTRFLQLTTRKNKEIQRRIEEATKFCFAMTRYGVANQNNLQFRFPLFTEIQTHQITNTYKVSELISTQKTYVFTSCPYLGAFISTKIPKEKS
jgi:hypothetical protein